MKKNIRPIALVLAAVMLIATIGIANMKTDKKEEVKYSKGYAPASYTDENKFSTFMEDTSIPKEHREAMHFINNLQNMSGGWAELLYIAAACDRELLYNGHSLYAGVDLSDDEWMENIDQYEDNYEQYRYTMDSLDPFNSRKYLQAYYAAYRTLTTAEDKEYWDQKCPGWEKWWQENYWSDDYVFPFPSDSYFANTSYCNRYNPGLVPIEYGVDPKKWSSDLEFIRAERAGTLFLEIGWTPSTNKKNLGYHSYSMYYVAAKHDFVRVTDCKAYWDGCFSCRDQYIALKDTEGIMSTAAYYYIQDNYDELLKKGEIYIDEWGIPVAGPKAPDSKYVWPMGQDEPNDPDGYVDYLNEWEPENNASDTILSGKGTKNKTTPTPVPTATPIPTATPVPTEEPEVTEEPVPTEAEAVPTEAPVVTEEPAATPEPTPTVKPVEYDEIPIASFPADEKPTATPIPVTDKTDILVATEATPVPTATQAPAEDGTAGRETVPTEERTEFPLDRVIPIVIAGVAVIGLTVGGIVIIKKKRR